MLHDPASDTTENRGAGEEDGGFRPHSQRDGFPG